MTLSPCSREKEVTELMAQGGWPQACPPELSAHLAHCRACADLALVTRTLQRGRSQTAAAARLGSPGALWWRAQLRRRQAAVERVNKPIVGAEIFAMAVSLLVAVTAVATQAKHGVRWLFWFEQRPQLGLASMHNLWPADLFSSGLSLLVLIPAAATLLLLSGALVYLVAERQ
jgi:hypothetical protein